MSKTRLWLERLGVVLITVVALGAPFVFGFVYFLGVTDGLEINAGEPLREARVWMIWEKGRATGIGWFRNTPAGSSQAGVQCARGQLTVLNWRGRLSIDDSVNYCKCYEEDGRGGLKESAVVCQ
jgi:hypothetical protein